MQRNAEFIWIPEQEINAGLSFHQIIGQGPLRRDEGQNRWFLFRKNFTLTKPVKQATLDITVDGRYLLFVNGVRVGRGPSRCSPYYQRVDTYDVSALLHDGDNLIAVLVHVYGLDTAWYETCKDYWQTIFGDGGLYCVCRGDDLNLVTDTSWRCMETQAWNRDTPLSGWGQDFIEDYDARKIPANWTDLSFDDNNWRLAQLLVDERDADDHAKGFANVRPFPTLIPRDIPHLTEEVVAPSEVLATYGVEPNPNLAIDKRIYSEVLTPCSEGCIHNVQALLIDDKQTTLIRTSPGEDVCLLLAFDALHAGYPFIDIEAHGGEIIEVAVAESYQGEFADEPNEKKKSKRCLGPRSFLECAQLFRYTARPGRQRFEKFEWTGFRYLQLVIRNAPEGLKIRQVGSNAIYYPVENQGAYACSDAMLTSLWKIGRHTVLQCSHDAWEDCPGREKRQWLGDGVVRYPIAAAVFGNSVQALDKRFLFQCLEAQRTDGLLQMYAPGDHKTASVVIPDYSLHFVLIAHNYMMHTGDLDTLETVLPGIQRLLAWFAAHVGKQQLLTDIPYWHFIEWANVGRSGAATSINALYTAALQSAAEIAAQLGYARLAKGYFESAATVKAAINQHLWDAAREVYIDGIDPQTEVQSVQVSQQANALLMAFDIAPIDRSAAMIQYITNPERVKLTSVPPIVPAGYPFDVQQDVVQCNTFFAHFLYCALAGRGRFDLVLDHIRHNYGPMLATGTTTLWESFDPTASLCHAFSASPTYQLSAYSLGVRPTAPGFTSFVVAPQFHDLNFAEGRYPTPEGAISVHWKRLQDQINIAITAPKELAGTLVAPTGYQLANGSQQCAIRSTEPIIMHTVNND